MHEQVAEKFAALFAECAVSGNSTELRKEAAAQELVKNANTFTDLATNPLVYAPLIGAGVGGASGYFGTEKEKDKKRNALYGAAMGGLGGLGLPLLALAANKGNAGTGAAAAAAAAPEVAPGDLSTNNPSAWTNPLAKALGFLTGGGAGGALGSKAVDSATRATVGRNGEIDRLAAAPGGKKAPNPYAAPLNQIIEKHRLRGQPITSSLDPRAPAPGQPRPWVDPRQPPKTPEAQRKLDAARATYEQKMKAWQAADSKSQADYALKKQIAERIVGKGTLGWRNKTRLSAVPVLEEMMRNNTGAPSKLPKTVLNDLGRQGRGAGRGGRALGYGVGSGVGSTLLSNPYVTDHIQNLLARLFGNAAPTAEAPAAAPQQ